MPSYQVYTTYSIDDSVIVEAENEEEAIDMVRGDDIFHDLLPYSSVNNCTISWDDVNVYDVQEVG